MRITIIGNKSILRNQRLLEFSEVVQANFSPPVFVREIQDEGAVDQESNQLIVGRKLLDGEIGCALAHWQVWETREPDWVLVLEDDAVFELEMLPDIEKALNSLPSSAPAVVHLFDRGASRNRPRLKRVWHQPAGTVCYAINRKARELATGRPVGTADWPLQLAKSRFYTFWGLGINEMGAPSLISPNASRTAVRPVVHYTRALARVPKVIRRFGISGVYSMLISPLIRDLKGSLSRFIG